MIRAVLRLTHPSGVDMDIELDVVDEVSTLETLVTTLLAKGYRPRPAEGPRGPGGGPLCLKHGGIEMQQRERQGDTWWSHKIVVDGRELYCRAVPFGPRGQDGFYH